MLKHKECVFIFHLDGVKRVIIPLASGILVHVGGVLPSLGDCTVVPDVAVVREHIVHVAELAWGENGG